MKPEAVKVLQQTLAWSESPDSDLDQYAAKQPLDEESVLHLVRGLRHWLISGRDAPALPAMLGLPSSAERARMAVRDAHLMEAARILEPEHRGKHWSLACALHREIEQFAGHRWGCWMDYTTPPDHASALQAALWWAMKAKPDAHRLTAQRLLQIIGEF